MQTPSNQYHSTVTLDTSCAPASIDRAIDKPCDTPKYPMTWAARRAAADANGDAMLAELTLELEQATELSVQPPGVTTSDGAKETPMQTPPSQGSTPATTPTHSHPCALTSTTETCPTGTDFVESQDDGKVTYDAREIAEYREWDSSICDLIASLNAPGQTDPVSDHSELATVLPADLVTAPSVEKRCESSSIAEIDKPDLDAARLEVEVMVSAAPVPLENPALHAEVHGYAFPGNRCVPTTAQELRAELDTLMREYKAGKDYAAVRDRYCAISIAINEQGLWAPRFRRQPLINPTQCKTPQSIMLHRDQLIIDAHWLWCKKSASMFSGKYEQLLDAELPFDFVLADAYAQENWASQYRVEEQLMLPDEIQWQLLTTRSKKHIEVHRQLFDGVRTGTTRIPPRVKTIQKAIAVWARTSPKIRGEEQAYADLWLAREMLGTKAAAKFIAELAGLMSGRAPLEASTIRQKLKGLNQRLLPI